MWGRCAPLRSAGVCMPSPRCAPGAPGDRSGLTSKRPACFTSSGSLSRASYTSSFLTSGTFSFLGGGLPLALRFAMAPVAPRANSAEAWEVAGAPAVTSGGAMGDERSFGYRSCARGVAFAALCRPGRRRCALSYRGLSNGARVQQLWSQSSKTETKAPGTQRGPCGSSTGISAPGHLAPGRLPGRSHARRSARMPN